MIIHNGGPQQSLNEVTLFPFDDYSIPFQNAVQLQLIGHNTPCGRTKIVLGRGAPGTPDSRSIAYYGTVIRMGDELWMWYLGQGEGTQWHQRVCFATSSDGYHWTKPDLGLVEYNGSKHNNIVDVLDGLHVQACVVFYEPLDPDPRRRFKMVIEQNKYDKQFAVAYSADGLVWHESPNNPVGRWFEMAGGTKLDGAYLLTGQGGNHAGGLRQLVTFLSYDFEYWTEASCMGLRRSNVPPRPTTPYGNDGEQVHLGAAMWNRGNVIIGFYGQWHGHPSNDRRLLTMDLGLAVTNDGLHYREPIPDFRIVAAAEDGWQEAPLGNTYVRFPALIQGQGFENVGDETLFWYAPWPEMNSDGIRVAAWKRDRLGYFHAFRGPRLRAKDTAHFVSAPIDLQGAAAQVFLNVDGLSQYTQISVEVLDERFQPLAGYEAAQCTGPTANGFRQPVTWQGRDRLAGVGGKVRLRVNFGGIRPEDARVFAAYVVAAD